MDKHKTQDPELQSESESSQYLEDIDSIPPVNPPVDES